MLKVYMSFGDVYGAFAFGAEGDGASFGDAF